MIDLRSDTVTRPTEEMRRAIAEALVGDDVYGEDPTTNELQEYTAELFGKEAALFVPTGCMGNQISIALHARTGDEVIVEAEAHIFHYETAAASIISRSQLYTIASESGEMPEEKILEAIRPDVYYFPRTALVCLENSHNRHGGTVISLDYIRSVEKICRERNIAFHCDGARIWNACAATDTTPAEYAAHFDTLSVCLSKGLGAPVGSLIVGSRAHIEAARKWRKILGGGMRQTGILAAAGLYAIKNHFPLMKKDHEHAKLFAGILSNSPCVEVEMEKVKTNIVVFRYPQALDLLKFTVDTKESGVLVSPSRPGYMRAVFHHQVSSAEAAEAAQVVARAIESQI